MASAGTAGRFAGSGDPNGGSDPSWPPFTQAAEKHLVLDLAISEGSDLLDTECALWEAPRGDAHGRAKVSEPTIRRPVVVSEGQAAS